MALPLLPLLGAAGIAAYLLLSGKSSAASAPAGGGGGGGGPSPYYGGGGGGGAPAPGGGGQSFGTSPGQIDPNTGMTILGPGGTSGDGGYLGNAVGSDGSGGSGGDPTAMNAAVATGTAAGVVGASGDGGGYCHLPDGSIGFWCEHPNVLDATGGRGGWVAAYDGHEHGFAPPGNLPIY